MAPEPVVTTAPVATTTPTSEPDAGTVPPVVVVAPAPTVPVVPDAGGVQEPEPSAPEPVPEPMPDPDWPFDSMNDPIDNPMGCPVEEPAAGDPCSEYMMVCKFGSELDCRSRWVCGFDGTWALNYGPRDCPESCPDAEPQEGDPCDVDRAVCDFGDDPSCAAQWLCWEGAWARTFQGDCEVATVCPATPPETGDPCDIAEVTPIGGLCVFEGGTLCGCSCYWEGGATSATSTWSCAIVSAEYPPDYLTACPRQIPEAGSACDTTSTCGYQSPDECVAQGTGTTIANCVDGQWVLSDSEMY